MMKEEIDIIIQDKSFFSIRKIETVSINKKRNIKGNMRQCIFYKISCVLFSQFILTTFKQRRSKCLQIGLQYLISPEDGRRGSKHMKNS